MIVSVKPDWISYTHLFSTTLNIGLHNDAKELIESATKALGTAGHIISHDDSWHFSRTRAPYRYGLHRDAPGCNIYFSRMRPESLIEISGLGCNRFTDLAALKTFFECVGERVTRLDVAFDIDGDIKPDDFVEAGFSGRFTSTGNTRSPSGVTRYIGSMKSERFARVYRYAEPHPRADLLRVEHVLRREYAREFIKAFLDSGDWFATCQAVAQQFGWKHPHIHGISDNQVNIHVPKINRSTGNSVLWLYGTVLSSLHKKISAGEIDAYDYIKQLLTRCFPDTFDKESESKLEYLVSYLSKKGLV